MHSDVKLNLLHQLTTKNYNGLEDLLKSCISFGCETFSMQAGMIGYFIKDQFHVQSVSPNWLCVEENMDIPIKDTYCHEVYRTGKTIAFEDAPNHPLWKNHEAFHKWGIKAYIATPVKVFDKFYGTLCFFSKDSREETFLQEDKEVIEIMANYIARNLELEEQKEMLASQEKLAAIGQMVGGIAHEINNPMAIISSNGEFVMNYLSEQGSLDRELEESLFIIKKTVNRVRDIVSGLKVIMGGGQNPIEWVCLKELADTSTTLIHDKLTKNKIKVVNEIDPNIYVYANKVQLSQVILNLVQNSHDAILEKQEKWIRFSADNLGDQIEFSVTDCGEGIPEDIADKIMEPLFTTKEIGKGTGLGLSLCQQMLEQFGGELFYDDKESNTCFKMLLPNKLSQMKVG